MAKSSGGTRIAKLSSGRTSDTQTTEKNVFSGYSSTEWEHTAFFEETGGVLVTSRERLNEAKRDSTKPDGGNAYKIYQKEKRMCLNFAKFGFRIEHVARPSSLDTADVVVRKTPNGRIYVNGMLADLKSLSSQNNVVQKASYAIHHQGAKIVLFEFTNKDKKAKILEKIAECRRKGFHGYYYFTGDKTAVSF